MLEQVQPRGPASWWISGEDNLRVRSFNGAASVVLCVVGRILTPAGDVSPFAFYHTPNTDRTIATTIHSLGEGWLLNVKVYASSGTPRGGYTFACVDVVRGLAGATLTLGTLAQGYVTDTGDLAWPGSLVVRSTDGRGVLRSVAGNNPAAGAECQVTVPTNARWRLRAFTVTLVTAVAVANREVTLTIDDGATVLVRIPSGYTQAASLTRIYTFAPGLQRFTTAQDTAQNVPIPDLELADGYRISTATTAIQGADDYGAPQLLVEEWIED